MTEYFVVTESNAAPMVSDTHKEYIIADTPGEALNKAIEEYRHPCGLYWVGIYVNADAYHKKEGPMLIWESENCKKHWTQQQEGGYKHGVWK